MSEQTEAPSSPEDATSKRRLALPAIVQTILSNQRFMKLAGVLVLAVSALSMCSFTGDALRTYRLSTASDETVQAILADAKQPTRSSAYHEQLAERASGLETPDTFSAQENILKALAISSNSPYAWAHLAYLRTVRAGNVTSGAVEALGQSIRRCLYCDNELIRWRLEYMLANWDELPDGFQVHARQHADILKADPLQHSYLRDIIIRARFQDIDLGIATHTLTLPNSNNRQ